MSLIKDNRSQFRYSQAEIDPVAFGHRLRDAADRLGYSAADVGRLANISKQSMSAYWNGARLCSSDRLFALADVLRIDARWLITGEDPVRSDDASFLDQFRLLDDHAKSVLLETMRLIVRSRP